MELKMDWQGSRLFSGLSPLGSEIVVDSLPEFGGEGKAATPMEMVLGAVIGCTGIDIISILEKMKYKPTSFHVEAKASRAEKHPKRFTTIHLHYTTSGEIDENMLYRAIELSLNKYCSVAYSLNAKLTGSYSLNEATSKMIKLE